MTPSEVYCVGGDVKVRHRWPFLVWGRTGKVRHGRHWPLHRSPEEVLDNTRETCSAYSCRAVGPAGRGHHPHINQTLIWLRQSFPERLISRRCEPEWAPHSPDFNPPDFYLWGFLKDNVYQGNPQTIEELKTAITAKIRAIPKEECVKVIDNFARRVQVCLQRNGGHLEHILGKP